MNLQTRRIIWGAIVFSTVLYLVVALFVAGNPEGDIGGKLGSPVVIALYVAAAMSFLAANFVPGTFEASFIVRVALAESVAVFGLLAAVIANDWRLFVGPWLLSLIGFIRLWPSGEPAAP